MDEHIPPPLSWLGFFLFVPVTFCWVLWNIKKQSPRRKKIKHFFLFAWYPQRKIQGLFPHYECNFLGIPGKLQHKNKKQPFQQTNNLIVKVLLLLVEYLCFRVAQLLLQQRNNSNTNSFTYQNAKTSEFVAWVSAICFQQPTVFHCSLSAFCIWRTTNWNWICTMEKWS